MSSIFLSHASADRDAAIDAQARLQAHGYTSVFLDVDPHAGLQAGQRWERELYRKIQSSRALVILCTQASMASRWCFAEFAVARALNKPVFPVQIEPCTIHAEIRGSQVADVVSEGEVAWERLYRGLAERGLDPRDDFGWDPNRSPYPGLPSFGRADAGVYFGREAEVATAIEKLSRMSSTGGVLLLVVGASGTGKSSLVRAGVLPRLEKDPDRWLLIPAFEPRDDGRGALALALVEAARGVPVAWALPDIAAGFRDEPPAHLAQAMPQEFLAQKLDELRVAKHRHQATAIITVDQLEQDLARDERHPRFCTFLADVLRHSSRRTLVVATISSDFLDRLQRTPALEGIEIEQLSLAPLTRDKLGPVIEGPATRAGLQLDPGLATSLATDAGLHDGLPLLAFTLRELYERDQAGHRLTITSYQALGGVEGSITHAADRELADDLRDPLRARALRRAFRALVEVPHDGRPIRRSCPLAEIPEEARSAMDRLVARRLLTRSAGDQGVHIAVAHEALFRVWPPLRGWLDADRKYLRWLYRTEPERSLWERRVASWAADANDALLVGARLNEAQRFVDDASYDVPSPVRRFVEESRRVARKTDRLRRGAVLAFSAVIAAVGTAAISSWRSGAHQEARAEAGRLAAVVGAQKDRPIQRLLLAIEAARVTEDLSDLIEPAAESALWTAIEEIGGRPLTRGDGKLPAIEARFDPSGAHVVFSEGPTLFVAPIDGLTTAVRLEGQVAPTAAAFSPDGRHLVSGGADGSLRWWTLADPSRSILVRHTGSPILDVGFSPDGRELAAVDWRAAHFWSRSPDGPPERYERVELGDEHAGSGLVSYRNDGLRMLVRLKGDAGYLRFARVIDRVSKAVEKHDVYPASTATLTNARIDCALTYPLARSTLCGSDKSRLFERTESLPRCWADPKETPRSWVTGGELRSDLLSSRAFSAAHDDGDTHVVSDRECAHLVSVGHDRVVRLWTRRPLERRERLGSMNAPIEQGPLSLTRCQFRPWTADRTASLRDITGYRVIVSEDGDRIGVAGCPDEVSRLWSTTSSTSSPLAVLDSKSRIRAIAFSPRDDDLVASVDLGQQVRLWNWRTKTSTLIAAVDAVDVAFAPDGATIATASPDGLIHIWRSRGRQTQPIAELPPAGVTLDGVRFSADGRTVVGFHEQGTAILWRSVEGGFAGPIRLPAVAGSTYGRDVGASLRFLVGRADVGEPQVAVIERPLATRALLDFACASAGRNLSRREWKTHLGSRPFREKGTCPQWAVEPAGGWPEPVGLDVEPAPADPP